VVHNVLLRVLNQLLNSNFTVPTLPSCVGVNRDLVNFMSFWTEDLTRSKKRSTSGFLFPPFFLVYSAYVWKNNLHRTYPARTSTSDDVENSSVLDVALDVASTSKWMNQARRWTSKFRRVINYASSLPSMHAVMIRNQFTRYYTHWRENKKRVQWGKIHLFFSNGTGSFDLLCNSYLKITSLKSQKRLCPLWITQPFITN